MSKGILTVVGLAVFAASAPSTSAQTVILSGDRVQLLTRRAYFLNCHDSVGNVAATPQASLNPNVSDEIFTILKVGGDNVLRGGDMVVIRTRKGLYLNCH